MQNKQSSKSTKKKAPPAAKKKSNPVSGKGNFDPHGPHAKKFVQWFISQTKRALAEGLDKKEADRLEIRSKEYNSVFAEATKDKERLTNTFGSLSTKPGEW